MINTNTTVSVRPTGIRPVLTQQGFVNGLVSETTTRNLMTRDFEASGKAKRVTYT